ncbi:hypothetical protein ACN38_g2498 [Penicillium nordicum]|uniref:Uncharacterized protein n=1 Tax=Penicillium nordicum TaxID=229535 RepID=A0A0N0RZP0_9EURO|nr:hypothetical protein ACN38_g2498 [Penicillium nordicum]
MASPGPTQFFTEAFAGVSYDEDPQKALQGLDEWEIPESIYRKDGSCMSIWELARVNGYHFEGDLNEASGSDFDKAFVEFGVNPVVGPVTLDHLELDPELSTPIVIDDVIPPSTCSNQSQSDTVYPLNTLNYLENANVGPPMAVVQLTPATQKAPVTIAKAIEVAPVIAGPVAQVATQKAPVTTAKAVEVGPVTATPAAPAQVTPTTGTAIGTVKVFDLAQGKSRPQPAKRPPKQKAKQKAKRAPKNKENDELHTKQKKAKANSTPRKAKGKTTAAPVTPPQKIAPAPTTPMPVPMSRFPASMTPVTGDARKTSVHSSQQEMLRTQQRLQDQENLLRIEWHQVKQQHAQLKQQQPGNELQLQIHQQLCQLNQQQFLLCLQRINQHKAQVCQFRNQFQIPAPQPVQHSTQMQAVYPTPPKDRMLFVMKQTQQLQAAAGQPVQHSAQMQAVHPTPPKDRMQMQSVMKQTQQLQAAAGQQVQQPAHQMQGVSPITHKERMQSIMHQTQNIQTTAAQRAQQPIKQMQSVSSLSATSPKKRDFQFMENIVPTNFVANPNNHARWGMSPNGDRTYLGGPQAKKARTSRK